MDILKFSPGGSHVTIVCVQQASLLRSDSEMLTQGARMVDKMRHELKECHTRAMKTAFKRKIQNIANIQPSVLEFIYAELAMDASAASNPEMNQRIRLMFMGHDGLIVDLRHLNTGRPGGYFDVFFKTLISQVEEITAADDRRHGVAHMSQWISLDEMIEKAAEACPEGTPIPSKTLVRLQFVPTNPYTHAALNFTSSIQIQRKIQRRQLRSQHEDEHYCNALFKYLKHKAVELGEAASLVCCDDKAKVKVGEPSNPVSTGVRGRESFAPVTTEICALDHDMTKASLTPSVILQVKQKSPSVGSSFVEGKVTTAVNDSAFQRSSPFRHAVMLKTVLEADSSVPNILLKYTDGGTDQRNTLESVKCATICLFKEMAFDMVVAVRCAPGHSFMNPAERVMSILNYGLQNCATERQKMSDATENILKKCSSSTGVRTMAEKHHGLKEQWLESLKPVQDAIRNRFSRLKLKDEPICSMDPVTEDNIDLLKRHLREAFPDLNLQKLQKQHNAKNRPYVAWKQKHCRETHYTFQVRKCEDEACCPRRVVAETYLTWLPEPVLDESGEHYKTYEDTKSMETTEKDRPSLKPIKVTKKTATKVQQPHPSTSSASDAATPQASTFTSEIHSDFALTTQTSRATAVCVECTKPRVVYFNRKLSQRQEVLLITCISQSDFTCGSHLFPPSCMPLLNGVTLRPGLTCAAPIELPYYGAALGRKDLCCFCAAEEAITDTDLKKTFKTVLPICTACRDTGKLPITQRPFGKQ